jgi:ribosome-binding factor A
VPRRQGKPPSQRQLKVGEELRHRLVEVLARGHFRDPALASASITVTEVRVSPDLSNATAYVLELGGKDPAATVEALRRAAAYLRGQVGRGLTLRVVPQLSFAVDASFDEAARIERLLKDPKVAADLAATPDEDGGDERA